MHRDKPRSITCYVQWFGVAGTHLVKLSRVNEEADGPSVRVDLALRTPSGMLLSVETISVL